ncbi:unnamed protein product [Coffea canephora]|uniref:SET domain-containing protein n=1 Tax=Coffea canephora TaxID=49390 RepID=A0A068UJ76_COFCA|nr:unnamed protein product [Coffea canephora]
MVCLLNGGLSDGNPNKRSLESGYHPSNSGNASNYKSRKVSAVRDFPPMCGPNTQPHLEAKDNKNGVLVSSDNAPAALEANCVKDESQVDTQSHELGGGLHGVEGNGSLDKLVEKVVAGFTDSLDDGVKKMALDVKPAGMELMKEVERKTILVGPSKGEVNGREAEAAVMELDKKEITTLVRSIGEDVVKPTVEIDHVVHREVSIEDGSVPSPKNKFRTRRVSAIRDFPPFCGRNAPVLSMQESLKITSGESSLGMDKVNMEKRMMEVSKDGADSKALKDGADSRTSVEILPAKVQKDTLEKVETGVEVAALEESITFGGKPAKGNVQVDDIRGSQARGVVSLPKDVSDATILKEAAEGQGSISKAPDLFEGENTRDRMALDDSTGSGHEDDPATVTGLHAAPHCPLRLGKVPLSSSVEKTRGKDNEGNLTWRSKAKAFAKKTIVNTESSERSSLKKVAVSVRKGADGNFGAIVRDEGIDRSEDDKSPKGSTTGSRVDVNLPPFGPSSSNGDARNRVRETLRLFQALCRKILQGEESRPEEDATLKRPEKTRRIDLLAAKIIKEKGKEVNTGKQYLGAVPGVEVGDEFQYRVELAIVGIHRLYQAGIDYMKHNGVLVATSIVASGAYDDDMENADVLIYSGQGGNIVGKDKQPEDQKLERGNLALWNCVSTKNPVRVIRGSKEKASDSLDSRAKVVTSYIYDGLYTVEKCRKETGTYGKLVFMFELKRIPGQPELAWKEVKKSKKSRVRQGVCIDDIAGGQETFPVCAVNTIDSEKPQQFNYIRKMKYPDWFRLVSPKGCDCTGKCSDSRKCYCAQRNGGGIPYNRNGAIVEAKPLVFECGPHCKCPPTCYNRVSQHGIKIQLEIFKTKSRGWGVRSLYSIPSGSFICEYAGELLEDKEAELRAGSDEYFEAVEEGGYTIDAAKYGNIGRFINHSCSPNLYAQDVLYDHADKRVPHVMLFAADNIPPLQELTYHYNYGVGQVHDSKGNIKVKSCYCGSTECIGRMY